MHFHYLNHTKSNERAEMYICLFLRALALALIGIFIPAYLLTLRFSLSTVLIYLAVSYALYSVFSPLAAWLAHKYGLKKTVLAAPFITIIHIVGLYSLKYYPFLLFPLAAVGSLAVILFWIPITAHFAANTSKHHVAEQSSHLHITSRLGSIIGPLAGGLIITYLGFGPLYTVSAALLVLSTAPLFLSRGHIMPSKRSWYTAFTRENINYIRMFSLQGIFSMCAALVFPFYVYIQTTSFQSTGFITAAMGVGVVISAIIAGKLSDRIGKHKTMRAAAIFSTAVFIVAIFLKGAISLYVVSVLLGLSTVLLDMTIFAIFCDKIRDKKSMLTEHIVFREFGLTIGRVVLFLAMLLLLTRAFELAFILAASSALYFVFTKF